jgi:hypothetical protein
LNDFVGARNTPRVDLLPQPGQPTPEFRAPARWNRRHRGFHTAHDGQPQGLPRARDRHRQETRDGLAIGRPQHGLRQIGIGLTEQALRVLAAGEIRIRKQTGQE